MSFFPALHPFRAVQDTAAQRDANHLFLRTFDRELGRVRHDVYHEGIAAWLTAHLDTIARVTATALLPAPLPRDWFVVAVQRAHAARDVLFAAGYRAPSLLSTHD
ncbi:MAG: hypothetical protein Q7V62_01830 [Actinomycetota bacterium]|nr:hypothetical protein [Actinomycetota bacterium]